MALPLGTQSNNYVFGRGKLYLALLDANYAYVDGERYLGNCPGFTLTVTSETVDHFSSTSGLRTKDATVTLSVDFAANIVVDNISTENQALFVGGTVDDVDQVATPVTDESIGPLATNREYQLGTSVSNPTGVRDVGSVSILSEQGDEASAWVTLTAYALGDVVIPTTPNSHWYMATTAGTTAGPEPTWPTNGSTVVDGTVTWRDMGLITWVLNTDYQLDATSGRFYVMTTGAIATAIGYATTAGVSLTAHANYTPTAGSRQQITSGTAGAVTAALRYVSDNAAGANRDLYIARAAISPNGEMAFITETDWAQFELAVGVSERDSSTAAIIIDGRHVAS